MVERAITYARVSGDDRGKEGRNLAGQLAMCKEFALKKGYSIFAELAEDDRGASGASFELEQLSKILELADQHGFDVLIVREIDRLSRNLAKQLIVEEELRRAGVRIEYVLGEYPDNPEGDLMKHIRAAVAEYEREKIRERITRGKRLKVKSGSVMTNGTSRPPYGYQVIKIGDKWQLEVHEPEARIVRMIYEWYAHGNESGQAVSLRKIARTLNQLQVPTRLDTNPNQGGHKRRGYAVWSKAQLANILSSKVYKGIWTFGKRPAGDKRRGTDLIEVPVPSIVDEETWETVQQRRVRNQKEASLRRGSAYLLSGRMKCGRCGTSYNGEANNAHGYRYYRCLAIHKGDVAHNCNMPSFRVDQVDAAVWSWIVRLLTDPVALEEGLQERLKRSDKEASPLRTRLAVADDMLRDHKNQLGRVLDLYIAGDFPKDVLVDRKKRLEDSIRALEAEIASIADTLERTSFTPQQMNSIKEFAKRVGAGLAQVQGRPAHQRQIVEALDVRVVFAVEKGDKVIYAQCALCDEPEKFGIPSITTRSPCPTPW